MPQHEEQGHFLFWGLVGLLAIAPLVRGGHQAWTALMVASGTLVLLALGWLRGLWRGSPSIVWSRQDLALLAGLLWVLLGVGRPAAPPDAFNAFLIVLGCAACFFLARCLAYDRLTLPLARSLCAIGGAIALVGLLQIVGALGHDWWYPPRFVAATFINHNHFAAYLELLLPLGCVLWVAAPCSPGQRFLVAVCCALMAIGFIVSCSRGAWLSLALSAALCLGWFGFFQRRSLWGVRGVLVIALAAAAIGFLMSQPPIVARGMSLLDVPNDPSFQTRQAIWQGAWDLAWEHPLIGHGLGSFQFAFLPHRPSGLYRRVLYAFNEPLQLVAELGLVGLTIATLIAVVVIWRVVRLVRLSQTPWKRAVGLGGLIGLGSITIHSLVDYPWHIPAIAFTLATVAGLVAGVRYHADPHPLRTIQVSVATSRARWARRLATAILIGTLVAAAEPLGQLVVADMVAYRGGVERESGELTAAVASYREAIRRAPRRVTSHRGLGESLVQLAWRQPIRERRAYFQQAAAAYRAALALMPREAWCAHGLADLLKATGELAEADRWLSVAVARDPQNPLYWKHWAEVKLLRGEAAGAFEAFRRAAGLAKPHDFFPSLFSSLDDPRYFLDMGDSAWLLGRLGLARTAFTIAASFDPSPAGAEVGLALCLLRQGDLQAAQARMARVHDPLLRAKWFAGTALDAVERGQTAQASAALETSLQLDPSNVLARHLALMLARDQHDELRYVQAVDQVLALNRPPVFVRSGTAHEPLVVWEPARGIYHHGRKTGEGWTLSRNGAIQQSLVVPPGKARFRVEALGTKAAGLGPTVTLSWNGRVLQTLEVASGTWSAFVFETEVKPGESQLMVDFVNDRNDLLASEDRSLTLRQVTASWEPL